MNSNAVAPTDQPTTTGKVVIVTTNGELEVELWARQAPLACRNFIQLALEGYYNDTIFHRMIPNFMIQGGDPTGTGTGGQSIYGSPFKDQFHQRLKFNRRGILAMANNGKDSNGSQFFITFAQCPQLNKTNTIFGKLTGDSIYNLLSFQSLDTDPKQNDRPLYPPYIKKIRVILNPFDDIIPRTVNLKQQTKSKAQILIEDKKQKKETIKKLKSKNKLTFDEEGQHDQTSYKIKSSHDALNDEKLSKKVAVTQQQLERKRKQKQKEQDKKREITKKLQENMLNQNQQLDINEMLKSELIKKKKLAESIVSNRVNDEVLNYQKKINPQTGKVQLVWEDQKEQGNQQNGQQQLKMQRLRELQQRQHQAMIADELNFKKIKQGSAKQKRKQLVLEQKTLLSNAEKRRYEYLKKNHTEKREGQVFNKLTKFTQKLKIENPNNWMCHSLKFHIDSQNAYNLDKKNQQRKGQEDEDDGGLKVEYEKYELEDDELDLDELNQLAKGAQN